MHQLASLSTFSLRTAARLQKQRTSSSAFLHPPPASVNCSVVATVAGNRPPSRRMYLCPASCMRGLISAEAAAQKARWPRRASNDGLLLLLVNAQSHDHNSTSGSKNASLIRQQRTSWLMFPASKQRRRSSAQGTTLTLAARAPRSGNLLSASIPRTQHLDCQWLRLRGPRFNQPLPSLWVNLPACSYTPSKLRTEASVIISQLSWTGIKQDSFPPAGRRTQLPSLDP